MHGEFSTLARLLPEAMLLVAGDGVIRAANPAAGALLRLAPEALVGRRLSELTGDSPESVAALLRACSRSRALVPGILTLAAGDGSTSPCRTQGAVMTPGSAGAPALVLLRLIPRATAIDRFIALNQRVEEQRREIARRRRLEEALHEQRELLQVTLGSIGDAVITTDAAGLVTFMNRSAELHTGWRADEARGRPLAEVFVIVNEETRMPVESPAAKVLATGLVVGLANHTVLLRRDGTELPIDDSGAPIRDLRGRILGVVLVFHDITERRDLERRLERKAARLLETDRRKDEFLAMLAHELRNPLAPLRNGVEVLRASCSGDATIDQIGGMMDRQIQHLTRLVDDLLDVSRITRGQITLRPEPVPLRAVIERAVEMVRPNIDARDQELTLTLPARTLWVDADPTRLAQVFANLLTNASKFTPTGGAIVVTGREEDRGEATVRVRDTGRGIPRELLPAVFDLFTQAERSLDRSEGGLGVGLTLVRTLVELHGGSVTAHSEGIDQGSEFVVRLPAIAPPGEGRGRAREDARPAGALASRRVLVVDDNVDAGESLAQILQLWSHEVRVAYAGPSALEIVEAFAPDVVLLDIGLPGMDGFELARRLRASPGAAGAMYVAITGYSLDHAKAAGFDHHLTKPVDLEKLRVLVGQG